MCGISDTIPGAAPALAPGACAWARRGTTLGPCPSSARVGAFAAVWARMAVPCALMVVVAVVFWRGRWPLMAAGAAGAQTAPIGRRSKALAVLGSVPMGVGIAVGPGKVPFYCAAGSAVLDAAVLTAGGRAS